MARMQRKAPVNENSHDKGDIRQRIKPQQAGRGRLRRFGLFAVSLWRQDDKANFAGDRISVLSFERTLAVDPRLDGQPVQIPPPFRNRDWANPGGFASHAAYHLELDGLTPLFDVQVVDGNSGERRIKAPPIVAAGSVFAMGASLDVVAVDAETGALRWQQSVAAQYREPNHGLTRC